MSTKNITLIASLLATLAMSPAQANAKFTGCRSLDYDAFYAAKPAGTNPVLGPQGLYFSTSENDCTVLDFSQSGFADAHPELHNSYTEAIDKVIADAAEIGIAPFKEDDAPALLKRTPGCGQVCGGENDACLYPCKCRLDSNYCVGGGGPDNCFSIYKCKG